MRDPPKGPIDSQEGQLPGAHPQWDDPMKIPLVGPFAWWEKFSATWDKFASGVSDLVTRRFANKPPRVAASQHTEIPEIDDVGRSPVIPGMFYRPSRSIRAEVDFLCALVFVLRKMHEDSPKVCQGYRADVDTLARFETEPWENFWARCEQRLRTRVFVAASVLHLGHKEGLSHVSIEPYQAQIPTSVPKTILKGFHQTMYRAYLATFCDLRGMGLPEEYAHRWSFYIAILSSAMTAPEENRIVKRRQETTGLDAIFAFRNPDGTFRDVPADVIGTVKGLWAFGSDHPHVKWNKTPTRYSHPNGPLKPTSGRFVSDFAYSRWSADGRSVPHKPFDPGEIFRTPNHEPTGAAAPLAADEDAKRRAEAVTTSNNVATDPSVFSTEGPIGNMTLLLMSPVLKMGI